MALKKLLGMETFPLKEEEIMSNDVKINSLRIKYFGDEEDCDNIADILQKLIKELRG